MSSTMILSIVAGVIVVGCAVMILVAWRKGKK